VDELVAIEALRRFRDRCDTECGRWFDHEAGVLHEQAHACHYRLLPDQDGVVGHDEQVDQNLRDGVTPGNVELDCGREA
jgi:hypothetical protein